MTQFPERITSYIPSDLYQKIEARAQAAHRKMSQEVAWELEQWDAAQPREKK